MTSPTPSVYLQLLRITINQKQHITHRSVSAVVFGSQIETREAAWQIQATEKPNQVPEDDGVMIYNGCRGDGLIPLVLQQTLQLFPEDQRTEVRHGHCLL